MAKIGIFSDTHGSSANLDFFQSRLGQLDSVFHLGDCVRDAEIIAKIFGTGYAAVRGNCDPYSDMPLEKVIEWDGHRILMLHGHTVAGRLALYYKASANGCDCVLSGHTHVASVEQHDGVLMVNPGSPSLPRGGQKPSCALLIITPEKLSAEIISML